MCGVRMLVELSFCHSRRVLQTDGQTDGRTDGRTDGQTDGFLLTTPCVALYAVAR